MNVPYRSDDEIQALANEFLKQHHPLSLQEAPIIPIPIELIVEVGLGLEIVPFRGYRERFNIDGSISTDLTNITIDETVLERYHNRLRFTLAHEVGHLQLHAEIIKTLSCQSTEDWSKRRLAITEPDRKRMEIQASQFAGCILVPEIQLRMAYRQAKEILAANAQGLEPEELTTSSMSTLAGWIAKQFLVSTQVVEIRLQKMQA